MGIGVTLIPEIMSAKEAAKRTTMYKNHAFEEYVSELISLDRLITHNSIHPFMCQCQSLNISCKIGRKMEQTLHS